MRENLIWKSNLGWTGVIIRHVEAGMDPLVDNDYATASGMGSKLGEAIVQKNTTKKGPKSGVPLVVSVKIQVVVGRILHQKKVSDARWTRLLLRTELSLKTTSIQLWAHLKWVSSKWDMFSTGILRRTVILCGV